MEKHHNSNAIKSSREKIKEFFKDANDLLDDLEDIVSEDECNFTKETIDSKSIPTLKSPIKDHKDPNEDGDFPTRIVVPAMNFTAGFPKLGFTGIEKIFDKNKIDHMKKTIIQASDLKQKLEKLKIVKNNSTIASLDIVSFYPSVQFHVIEKAVNFTAKI